MNISVSYFPRVQVESGLLCSEDSTTYQPGWTLQFKPWLCILFFCYFSVLRVIHSIKDLKHLRDQTTDIWTWFRIFIARSKAPRSKCRKNRKKPRFELWEVNLVKQPLRSEDSAIIQCWHCRSGRRTEAKLRKSGGTLIMPLLATTAVTVQPVHWSLSTIKHQSTLVVSSKLTTVKDTLKWAFSCQPFELKAEGSLY